MFRYNFFIVFILLTLCILLSSCSKKDVSLSKESSYKNLAKNNSKDNKQENSPQRRGIFSILAKSFKKESNKLNNNIQETSKQHSFNKKSTINNQSKIVKEEQFTNKQDINNDSNSNKDKSFIKSVTSFFNIFSNNNLISNQNIKYPVDKLSVKDGLNIAVIRIPEHKHKKEYNEFYSENKNLLKNIPTVLPKDISFNILNNQAYYDIFGINNITENYLHLNKNNAQNTTEELSPFDIYKNYFLALKYEGLLTNYNEVLSNKSLSLLHRALITQLLLKKRDTPHVLYLFYRKTTEDINISSKEHLYLTSYLNNMRSYIYSKNVPNLYLQEVQIKDLPVDEILIVLKPITIAQYNCLPKQINIFNAKKMSIKTWVEKTKLLEKN